MGEVEIVVGWKGPYLTSRGAPGPKLCPSVASIKQRTTVNQRSLQIPPGPVLLAHALGHRPCHRARCRPPCPRRRARPSSHTRLPPRPRRRHPIPTYTSGGFLSSSRLLACLSALVSRIHRIPSPHFTQRVYLNKAHRQSKRITPRGVPLVYSYDQYQIRTRRTLGAADAT